MISVIVPVYNGAAYLERSLASIKKSKFKNFELIVVDDASTDATPTLLKNLQPDIMVRNATRQGAFQSRNRGVSFTRGTILFFTDVDVLLADDTLEKVWHYFQNSHHQCLIGLYSLPESSANTCTLYKNAWIRFSYLQAPIYVDWFFTGAGAIRKELWDQNRQFKTCYQVTSGGGDLEFGRRLSQEGIKIFLHKDLEVGHLKNFSLTTLLQNDFKRAYGFSLLALSSGYPLQRVVTKGFANIVNAFVMSVGLSMVLLIVLFLWPDSWLLGGIFLFYIVLNIPFLVFLKNHFSFLMSLMCFPIMVLDHLACALGVAGSFISSFVSCMGKRIKF